MATDRKVGKASTVELDATTPAELVGTTEWELTYDVDEVDVTGNDSAGAGEFEPTISNAQATIKAFAVGELDAEIRPGLPIKVNLYEASTDEDYWYGDGFVMSCKPSVSIKGAVTWNIAVRFSGAVTYGART